MHSYGNVSIAGERPMRGAYGLGTGRGLYRAIPTMTRVLGLHNLGCWGPFLTWILTGSREDQLNKLNLSKRASWFRETNQRWQAKIHHFRLVKFKQTTLQDLIVRTQLTSLEYFTISIAIVSLAEGIGRTFDETCPSFSKGWFVLSLTEIGLVVRTKEDSVIYFRSQH